MASTPDAAQRPSAPAAVDHWAAVTSVALGTFVLVTSEFMPVGMLTTIADAMGVSRGAAGAMITVPGLVAAVAAPIATLLLSHVDRRTLLLSLSMLILVSNAIVAMSPSYTALLAGRVVLGLAVGGFWTYAAAVGRKLVREDRGQRATTIIVTGVSLGTVCGVPLGALLASIAGWRAAFWAIDAIALTVLVAQWLLLPSIRVASAGGVGALLGILHVRAARLGFIVAALVAAGHFTAYTYLEPFLSQLGEMNSGAISAVLAGYGIAGVAGTLASERALARSTYLAFLSVIVATAAGILIAAVSGSVVPMGVLGVLLWGAAFGAVPATVQTWTYKAAPDQFEAGSALLVSIFQVALAAGALIGGGVVDQAGVMSAFLAGGLIAGSAALLLAGLRRALV